MSVAGGHHLAVRAAAKVGFRTVQVFTKSSNQWHAKPLDEAGIELFRQALSETGLLRPVAHTSYLINLASPDPLLWRRSVDALIVEVERAGALGIPELVHHPGAHMGAGESAGLGLVIKALDEVIDRTGATEVRIDLESTAGQGTTLGHRLEHLAELRASVRQPERVGICLDTCHLFAAGYQWDDPERYDHWIAELERTVGINEVRVWHLNDSVRECGSRVDRHAGLGRGELGLEAFRRIVNEGRFAGCPMILETPKGEEDGRDLDRVNLEILLGLLVEPRAEREAPDPKRSRKRATRRKP
jgi:deoxyribonuclease IV